MTTYSQRGEDRFVLNYFGGKKGTLLEIGANDGRTLSNSLLLIEHGWAAHLIEPASVFTELQELHKDNPNVHCYNYGIGDKNGTIPFWESENHVPNGLDKALVSTFDENELKRWPNVKFNKKELKIVTFDEWWRKEGSPQIDFVSIDAEGFDWKILQQMPLDKMGCSCLCIEYNGNPTLYGAFTQYCEGYGLKLKYRNGENLIFCK